MLIYILHDPAHSGFEHQDQMSKHQSRGTKPNIHY